MVQTATTRYLYRLLPGAVSSPDGAGTERESIAMPFTLQTFTLTLGGGGSPMAAGDYTVTWVHPINGTIIITVNSDGTKTFAAGIAEFVASTAASSMANLLYGTVTSGTVATFVAKDPNTDLAVPVTSVPGADTLTAAETVAPAAPDLRMGVFYVYGTPQVANGAVIGTPRGCRLAALPTGTTGIGDLRGIVSRVVNQTTLSGDFIDSTTFDRYRAGQVAPGLLRGEVACVVDPASGTIDALTDAVYVVIAAGTYSVLGSIADAADGTNTIRLDNTTPVRARVVETEETLTLGAYTGRCVKLKINQTN